MEPCLHRNQLHFASIYFPLSFSLSTTHSSTDSQTSMSNRGSESHDQRRNWWCGSLLAKGTVFVMFWSSKSLLSKKKMPSFHCVRSPHKDGSAALHYPWSDSFYYRYSWWWSRQRKPVQRGGGHWIWSNWLSVVVTVTIHKSDSDCPQESV